MWIVRLALRRPYTFVVAALLIVLVSIGVIARTPKDVFPDVDIPVISVVWTYAGLPAQQMEQQVTLFSEYSIAGNVAGIRLLESNSYDGISVIRAYLHQGVDVAAATAQVTATSQTIMRRMPPGIQPPTIVRYSATNVPILQLAVSSNVLSEAEVFDYVNNRIRSQLSVIRGTRFPMPMGGKTRQIVVDLDPDALRSYRISPNDVNVAVASQNLILPTGSAKLGEIEYRVSLNSSPEAVAALNDVPVALRDGRRIFLRDVAFVHDGYAVQTSIARRNGGRAVVMSVLKTGEASTLDIVRDVKALLPDIRATAPKGLKFELLADQSTFVTRAIEGLLTEGVIAALLTAAMILLFLGSWRSTLIVFVSIPLSVLIALLVMRALGQTINTMTLGGLALAVGILVDDATVEIENIHRNLAMGKPITQAILDGAQQIAVPAFVASLSIGIVFFSVLLLEGPAYYLFTPLGMSVGFSVMASYLLSRTLIPTLVRYLMPAELAAHTSPPAVLGFFGRVHQRFEASFESFRQSYVSTLASALAHPKRVFAVFGAVMALGVALVPFVGREFFPQVNAGQIRLHVTAPPGTRIEETERYFSEVGSEIKRLIPDNERSLILDQIGIPSGYSLAVTDSANVSSADGEVFIRLAPNALKRTQHYISVLREALPKTLPHLSFYFQPADMMTQVLNFGLPSPISVQVSGANRAQAFKVAETIHRSLREVAGAVDVRLHQIPYSPSLKLDVDRVRASQVGLTQRDVANDVLLAVSSSGQVAPNYWVNPETGFNYPVAVQVPERRIDSLEALNTLPLTTTVGTQLFGDLARISRQSSPVFTTHVDVQPTYEVRADVEHLDLGRVTHQLDRIVKRELKHMPPGLVINVRGQVDSMRSAFTHLFLGLLIASLLVYGLMVINFQSWLDPLIMLLALPGAGLGIVIALLATETHLSVPSLMGAVMSIGLATANTTLLISFANEQRRLGLDATQAALQAGKVRLRPILMTALAMILGMLPMSLGLGAGGEQHAVLARAVLGGLSGATLATLFFVPVIYSVLRKQDHPRTEDPFLSENYRPSDHETETHATIGAQL